MNEKTKYWIDTAIYDLDTAKAMFDTGRYLYVGFMCHQTIEKAMKAVIAKSGKFPPKVHNLLELAKEAEIFELMEAKQKALLRTLNPLNIESRYPSYKSQINELLTQEICEKLIYDTEEMFIWIKSRL